MAMWLPRLLALLSAFSVLADAAIRLTGDVAQFIPDCAQYCVQSFVNANFPSCGETGQLPCVCQGSSVSGYTIGEGAVQCMTGEVSAGGCPGAAVPNAAQFVQAYSMCHGQAGAVSNTHTALTATLVLNPTNPTLLLVPSVTSTTSSSTSSSSSTQSPSPSATVKSNSTSHFNSTSSATHTSTSNPNPNQKLSTPTIIGIAVASVGGAALLFIAILFCCYKRRRKSKPRESDLIGRYQAEPNDLPSREGTRYRRMLDADGPPGGLPVRMIPPMPGMMRPERPPRPSSDEALRNADSAILESGQDTNTIGLAISELGGDAALQRRPTRHEPEGRHYSSHASILGPERASLDHPRNGDYADRRSVATTIEEEPDDASSGGDSWGARSTDRMLSTLSYGEGKLLNVNKNQPPSFLVTGGDGSHWQSGAESEDGSVKPEFYVKPLRVSKGPGETSRSGNPGLDLSRFPAPPVLSTLDVPPPENGTQASSYYGDSLPPSGRASQIDSRAQSQYKPYLGRESTESIDTVTTLESTLPPVRGSNILSPIHESPSSVRTHRSSVALPFQHLSTDVTEDADKSLKPEEIAAMRAMRMRTQQAQNMHHPLERTETGLSKSSQGSFAKRKPADLTLRLDEAERSKKGQWRVVDQKSRKHELQQELEQVPKSGPSKGGLAELTPTRKGEVLYLKVQ